MAVLKRPLGRVFPLLIFNITNTLQYCNCFIDIHFITPLFITITKLQACILIVKEKLPPQFFPSVLLQHYLMRGVITCQNMS